MQSNQDRMHEQLWAPWRLSYIKGDEADPSAEQPSPKAKEPLPKCFLCRYASAPTSADADNYVVARGESTLVVLNRYPYNNGHLLIAPMRHVADIAKLTAEESQECQREIVRMTEALQRLVSPDGFNVGLNLGQVAGAGLPGHLHWHVVPRWGGDTNFMPVLADVRVIPQSLAALHRMLVDELTAQD